MRRWEWKWRHAAAFILLCALVLATGCSMTTFYKAVATNAVASKEAYLGLDKADDLKQTEIRAQAVSDAAAARLAFTAWTNIYDRARKALNAHSDIVSGALRDAPALEAAVSARNDVAKWIAALAAAGETVDQALRDAGIDWKALLAGGKQ